MGSSHSMGSSLALHFKIQIICLMVCSSSYKRLWIFFVVYNIKKVLEQASEEFSFDQVLCARPLSGPSMYVEVCSRLIYFPLLQIRGDWYEPKDASALRNDT
jgi:hypothetical protein